MSRNTGEKHEEAKRLAELQSMGISFSPDDIRRTGTFLQIPTSFSDQDVSHLTKLVRKVDGEVHLKDAVAWVYLRHKPARPLWQQGVILIWWSLNLIWCVFYGEEALKQFLRFIYKWSSGF